VTEKRSGPNERQRALWALAGYVVPRVGDEGRWGHPTGNTFRVRVSRVSDDGMAIWVRFLWTATYGPGHGPERKFDRNHADGIYWGRQDDLYDPARGLPLHFR